MKFTCAAPLLALLIAHQAYTMPIRPPSARGAREMASFSTAAETASFSTTAEASIVASFQPLLAERLAACNPSRRWSPLGSKQAIVVLDDVLGAAACERLRLQAEAIRAGGMLEDCESSGAVRATQCAQGDDEKRAAAEDLVALPLAIARAVALRVNDAVDPHG